MSSRAPWVVRRTWRRLPSWSWFAIAHLRAGPS